MKKLKIESTNPLFNKNFKNDQYEFIWDDFDIIDEEENTIYSLVFDTFENYTKELQQILDNSEINNIEEYILKFTMNLLKNNTNLKFFIYDNYLQYEIINLRNNKYNKNTMIEAVNYFCDLKFGKNNYIIEYIQTDLFIFPTGS